ncbi:MAG: STAS domain-containing protein [Rhizobacter sp.]|nr:STAS domain-containing protein [Chlorobiales bacterium]
MKFSINTKKELTIFKLDEKRLDASLAPELKSEFVVLIEAEKKRYLIVDLSQVEAMDSSGLGAILMAHRQTVAHGGFAAFIGIRGKVKDLIKMAGLERQLNIFSSVQDVINSLETVEIEDDDDEETEFEDDIALEKELLKDIENIDDKIAADDLGEIAGTGDDLDVDAFAGDTPDGGGDGDDDGEPKKKKSAKSKPTAKKPIKPAKKK